MNLTELQRELRTIGNKVSELQDAVEQMKPNQNDERINEYKVITNVAAKYPLNRGLDKENQSTRDLYIKAITGIALMGEGHTREKLTYVSRIAAGIDSQMYPTERIVEMGLSLDETDIENIFMELDSVKYIFLVDAFVVSYISGEADKEVLKLLGEFSAVFGCNIGDVKMIAAAAKGVLTNDYSFLGDIDAWEMMDRFRCFFTIETYA